MKKINVQIADLRKAWRIAVASPKRDYVIPVAHEWWRENREHAERYGIALADVTLAEKAVV